MAAKREVSVGDRRSALVRRHRLTGDAAGPREVTRALLALHATDPASVYLSVLARSHASSLADVADALYRDRSMVRWMAMRRTLFVFDRDDIPLVHAAVGLPLADVLRRRLISRIERNGTEPPVAEAGRWLAAVEDEVVAALRVRGSAVGAKLSTDVPRLRTVISPGAASEVPQNLTSPLLTIIGTDGRMVRGEAVGAWTSRAHRWEPIEAWWPDGLPSLERGDAQRELVRRYLARFGPATADDVQWWTGWPKTAVRSALAGLPIEDVDLHGEPGIDLRDDTGTTGTTDADVDPAPVAALLPALDPTPMGWKWRDWFLAVDPTAIFDRAGNIGPTVWWDGEIVGYWAVAATGEVRTVILADRGREAALAVAEAAARLQPRLAGAVVSPAFRVALERALAEGSGGSVLR